MESVAKEQVATTLRSFAAEEGLVFNSGSSSSTQLFSSPLGPISTRDGVKLIPRFAYFGKNARDDSLRVAFFGGLNSSDSNSTRALLHFLQAVSDNPNLADGIHFSVYPRVDTADVASPSEENALFQPNSRVLALLRQEIVTQAFHVLIRVETSSRHDDLTVGLVGGDGDNAPATGIELISSEEFNGWPVRWENGSDRTIAGTVSDDLLQAPIELTFFVPATFERAVYLSVIQDALTNFLRRHRASLGFAQHI